MEKNREEVDQLSFLKIFKSRTVWTVIVIFVINGVQSITAYIPVEWLPLVNGLLGIAAIYFRVNTRAALK